MSKATNEFEITQGEVTQLVREALAEAVKRAFNGEVEVRRLYECRADWMGVKGGVWHVAVLSCLLNQNERETIERETDKALGLGMDGATVRTRKMARHTEVLVEAHV